MKLKLLLMVFVLTTAAVAQEVATAETATVIFFRAAGPNAWHVTITLDGKKVCGLGGQRYFAIHVPPGEHVIASDDPSCAGPSRSGRVTMMSGETYYFEVAYDPTVNGLLPTTKHSYNVWLTGAESGAFAVQRLKPLEPSHVEPAWRQP